jgi:hypothetical protein
VSDPRYTDEGADRPERDPQPRDAAGVGEQDTAPTSAEGGGPDPAAQRPGVSPRTEGGRPTTSFAAGRAWDLKLYGDRRKPTTAEQAVPWLIGLVLALTGIVIVLVALIFTGPEGLIASDPSATPLASRPAASTPVNPGASSEPSRPAGGSAPPSEPEATARPSPTPVPEYGPLEMVYLGRPSGTAPIYLLRRDFSVAAEPTVMAQAEQGVTKYVWAPDGRVGAAIIAERAVALTPGESARPLADDIDAITFGWHSQIIYAVRIVPDGVDDRAEVLQIDFLSGEVQELAAITYPRPVTGPDAPLREAQFIDDGGLVRLYALADGNIVLWVLGAPAIYRIDPGDGRVTEAGREPVLWSPNGRLRITLFENETATTTVIGLRDQSGDAQASVSVNGLVSHVRWAATNNEIVFTLGQTSGAGGVRQDLYVWDLQDGVAPLPLTSNGASFGAEWLGVNPHWLP